ncbi:MAG: hypothetical protein M3Q69_07585 [Acidobacteriota bacterium]|nr:hypothetical protein [Acidobacteriota bacterium]
MHKQIAIILATFFLSIRAHAGMVRVVTVENGNTITVEREGVRSSVTLAGITITDEAAAKSLLEWTITATWVMAEPVRGGAFIYRSPDALFLNRELVTRGFARATMHGIEPESHVPVTYLGTLNLPAPPLVTPPRARTAPEPPRGSGSATRRRSQASPSPRARSRR